jgi:glycosyltransferase involved in cell wall biosynthesis
VTAHFSGHVAALAGSLTTELSYSVYLIDKEKGEKRIVNKPRKPLTILRLLLGIDETSAPYNQFSLALANKHNITLCTYFRSNISPPQEITLFEGDGSLKGFFRVLKAAFEEKEYDIIHVHHTPAGFLLLVASIMYGKSMQSTVFTVHNSYQNHRPRNRLLLIPIFAFFQRVVCCGQASLESFPGLFRWLAGDRICAVQNGIDIERVDRVIGNKQKCLQGSNFTITTVGRLIKIKNHLSVLKAFQQSADQSSRLVFVGEGPVRDELLTELETSGLGNQVEITGLIPRDRVYEELTRASLFTSASWGEGLPIAALEAMACRCPVILSDIPPHREIAAGMDFIPLIQPDDVAGFAREIRRFRQMVPSERVEIGEKCRKLVEERFSLLTMHEGYEGVYAQVLGEH